MSSRILTNQCNGKLKNSSLSSTLIKDFPCFAGSESQREASVSTNNRATVQPMHETGEIQEAAILPMLLSLCTAGEKEVPHVGMEYSIRVQRL